MSDDEKHISLNQIIDLIHAGPEIAAKMGQYPKIWEQMPALCKEIESITEKLGDLGIDGWGLLRRHRRLKKVFNYYDCWKTIQLYQHDNIDRPLSFTLLGSPVRKHNDAMLRVMKELIRKNKMVELRLKDNEMQVSASGIGFSIPAQYPDEGHLLVKRGFIKILIDLLRRDEVIKCRTDGTVYEINGVTYRPSDA